MMEWIRLDAAARDHHKFFRLAKLLHCDRGTAFHLTLDLWMSVAATRSGGILDGISSDEVAAMCRCDLDGDVLVEAFVSAVVLDRTDVGLTVHDWLEYQGSHQKSQALAARRQSAFKARQRERSALSKEEHQPKDNGEVTSGVTLALRPDLTDRTGPDIRSSISSGSPPRSVDNSPRSEPETDDPAPSSKDIHEVYLHYLSEMGLTEAHYKLTDSRRAKIRTRLTEYELPYLKAAITACRQSEYHMGNNPANRPYNDLARNILISEEKVEWWVNGRNGGAHAKG